MENEHKLQHIAIIMDGNRRWATERGLPKLAGHTEGAKTLKKIAEAIAALKIPYFTVFALSTENIKNRTEQELKHLFDLFNQLPRFLGDFIKHEAKLKIIGNIAGLPEKTQKILNDLIEKTKHNKKLTLTLAVNYGGRDEIVRAAKKLAADAAEITEESFSTTIDTAQMPNVDLLIRTGGEQRLSGFMMWQSTYAELYFTPVKWPAFSPDDLKMAIDWFNTQKRNGGK